MVRKNKKGWIKVAESFLAIFALMTIVFVIIQNDQVHDVKKEYIIEYERGVLTGIQINDSLREDAILINDFTIDSRNVTFPDSLKNYLNSNLMPNVMCYLKVCLVDDLCNIDLEEKEEIYVSDVLISNYLDDYGVRKVKIFCTK